MAEADVSGKLAQRRREGREEMFKKGKTSGSSLLLPPHASGKSASMREQNSWWHGPGI